MAYSYIVFILDHSLPSNMLQLVIVCLDISNLSWVQLFLKQWISQLLQKWKLSRRSDCATADHADIYKLRDEQF